MRIRLIVKEAFLFGRTKAEIDKRISRAITGATEKVNIECLKGDIERSLWSFANRQRTLWSRIPFGAAGLAVIIGGMEGRDTSRAERKLSPIDSSNLSSIVYEQHQKGVPLQQYYTEVWKEKVKPIFDRICAESARDPNDRRGRNTLRNLAEMEVRYQEHQENIQALRNSGVRLVMASSHADCSDRCAKWQGRVYSLDGTSGFTSDGRKFVPLEEATDIYYTTKAGRTYKNGLLGFNCRHHLMAYREGVGVQKVSVDERKREYAITRTQRQLEREVRLARTEAEIYKGLHNKTEKVARQAARAQYDKYKAFCEENNRAYYPMRVEI